MIEVELSNGQIAEFPDEMTQEQIATVLRSKFPPTQAPQNSAKNIQEEKAPEGDMGAYLDSLSSPRSDSFWSKLPKNILAGLAHAGENIHNLPHDISKLSSYLTPLSNIPGEKSLSDYLPNDTKNYSDVFGINPETSTLGDKIIQGTIEHIPDFMGGTGLGKGALRILPITKGAGSRKLKELSSMIGDKGIETPIPEYILHEVNPFFPKTYATKELLSNAAKGDYSSAFGLQSEMGRHQRELVKSLNWSDRNLLAPQAKELQEKIISHLETVFKNSGHPEFIDLLKEGRNDYRKYIKFKEKVLPTMRNLGIPTTGLALLGSTIALTVKAMNKISDEE